MTHDIFNIHLCQFNSSSWGTEGNVTISLARRLSVIAALSIASTPMTFDAQRSDIMELKPWRLEDHWSFASLCLIEAYQNAKCRSLLVIKYQMFHWGSSRSHLRHQFEYDSETTGICMMCLNPAGVAHLPNFKSHPSFAPPGLDLRLHSLQKSSHTRQETATAHAAEYGLHLFLPSLWEKLWEVVRSGSWYNMVLLKGTQPQPFCQLPRGLLPLIVMIHHDHDSLWYWENPTVDATCFSLGVLSCGLFLDLCAWMEDDGRMANGTAMLKSWSCDSISHSAHSAHSAPLSSAQGSPRQVTGVTRACDGLSFHIVTRAFYLSILSEVWLLNFLDASERSQSLCSLSGWWTAMPVV